MFAYVGESVCVRVCTRKNYDRVNGISIIVEDEGPLSL